MEPASHRLGGCSFELEVCFLPQMASTTPVKQKPTAGGDHTSLNHVGIRRKRLKGDSWCYKRVCEQVLALTATGFRQPTESSV